MWQTITLGLFIMCTAFRPAQAADTNLPVVNIDSKHQMVSVPAASKPEPYRIPACQAVILDATGYTFDSFPDLHGKPLNSIQVMQDKQHMFELTWQPRKTRYELSKASLQPLRGSQPFEKFSPGDRLIVSVGVVFAPKQFAPVWAGIVYVQ